MPQSALDTKDLAAYEAARHAAACFDLSERGKLEVIGPDARTFLHNLCSNDIRGLAPGQGCEAFFLTLKARVVAHGWIYCIPAAEGEPSLWLDLAPGMAATTMQHLDRHLISEQVELADRTNELAQLHVAGPQGASVLAAVLDPLPELAPLQAARVRTRAGGACQVRRFEPLALPGWDLLCPAGDAAALRQALAEAGAVAAAQAVYDVLRVEAGTPLHGIDIDDSHLAMEAGRTLQAISFSKGCYLGQEPIVRTRDLGHVNRTLLGVQIESATALPAGAKLFRGGEEVGYLTSSVVSPRLGRAIALGYVRRGSQEPGTPLEVEAAGSRYAAFVASLPFGGSTGPRMS